MKPEPDLLLFPPFRLDAVNERLWRESRLVGLRPKAFAVLRYLVEHAGELVSREELLRVVWPNTQVSEGVLRWHLHELREALGDKAGEPRFIETVAGRGYRFLGKVSEKPEARSQKSEMGPSMKAASRPLASSFLPLASSVGLVGREAELGQLHRWLEKALRGERQVVFVTGEPGIGKTTVVDAFAAQVGAGLRACPIPGQPQGVAPTAMRPDIWVARGQCVEHYGAGEAYLPVLEAL
ncbi:MAG: winged helix-turn-helix domain-containing protein, partial [Deltaproteobacteria bacterium]|nr:winged helix-turn-helix domain-containing protein [Deltaproteobacteria bacterium]